MPKKTKDEKDQDKIKHPALRALARAMRKGFAGKRR